MGSGMTKKLTYDELMSECKNLQRQVKAYRDALDALRGSDERHRTILDTMEEGYTEIDLSGKFTFVNDAETKMLGYSREELVGMTYHQYTSEQTSRVLYKDFLRIYKTGEPVLLRDYEIIMKDGAKRIHEMSVTLIRDDSGRPVGFRGVSRDVTERRQTEEALRKSEAKYRFLTENMNDIVWTADLDFNVTYDSPVVERILGYTAQERMGQKATATLTPESYAQALEVWSAELKRDQDEGTDPDRSIKLELEYYHKNGSTVWMECVVTAIRDDSGKIIGIHGVSRDISDRKQAEKMLGQFKFMVEETGEEIYLVNPDGSIEYVNKAAAQSLGYTIDEMIQIGVSGFDPIYGNKYYDVFLEIKAKDHPLYETVHRTKDGRLVQKEIKCAYLQMGDREYICGFGRDITDRKSAEMELKKHREKLEDLINERTAELTKAYEQLNQENEARKTSEIALRYRELELEKGRQELQEMNSALKVLLKQREEDKVNMEMNIISNIKTSVLPYIEKLELSGLAEGQVRVSSMIKSLLGELISPFIRNVSSEFLGFTPNEIQVASLIKEGKNSKDIAEILNISLNTVHTYRYKIRTKTGLKNSKVNLRSYLQTLR